MLKGKCSETDISSKIFLDNLCILFSLLATLVNSFSCTFRIVDVTVFFFFFLGLTKRISDKALRSESHVVSNLIVVWCLIW